MNWKLRIELWDERFQPKRVQTGIEQARKNLKLIMMNVADKMPEWKFLDRCEAAISTENEEKQIRYFEKELIGINTNNLEFHGSHSREPPSLEEWIQFAREIEIEINKIVKCRVELFCDLTTDDLLSVS